MSNTLIKTCENIDCCVNHYICATTLYLISMLSQSFSVIIDRDICSPVHGKEVVDDLNAIYNMFLFQLISIVQLPGEKTL